MNYNMSESMAVVLGQELMSRGAKNSQEIDHMWLSGNGLKDSGFASILRGLNSMENLKSISYTDNELGEETSSVLATWLSTRKVNIKSLILCNLKTSANNIKQILWGDAE